ncbi:MAG: OmpH family outer membrane protein [Bacteroidales bacterium]|jgi:outer membrane protein|nr:OmpH family outer membrane protein [Bacteroidales bacterium]MDD4057840.1 OmpH family outer membrane protein [Bacteroidales bacterium]
MKRFLTTIAIVLASIFSLNAQNYGYLNTQEILDKMPEYQAAQSQLDRIRETNEASLQTERERIEMLFRKYQSEKNRLSDNVRQARENEIITMERNLKVRQQEIFGQDGSFSKKTMELMEPIQQRIQWAIDYVSEEMGLGIVFDTNVMQGVLYKNPRLDITNRVLSRLNLK